jgi:two-component sensor histidine kinase/tetratricopeptide (TPR) repeat protein/GAF domain-containing protein
MRKTWICIVASLWVALGAVTMPDSTNVIIRRAIGSNDVATLLAQSNQWLHTNEEIAKLCSKLALESAEKTENTQDIIASLLSVGNAYYYSYQADSALAYQNRALELASSSGNDTLLLESYIGLIYSYSDVSNNSQAISIFQSALPYIKKYKSPSELSEMYNLMGVMEEELGNYDLALQYYLQTLEMEEATEDSLGIADAYNSLGNVYQSFQDINRALDYYAKADTLYRSLNSKKGISYIANNRGIIYHDLGRLEEAAEYYWQSLMLAEELNDYMGMCNSYNNIGSIYLEMGRFEESLEMYHKSLNISRERVINYDYVNTLNNIAEVHLVMHNPQLAYPLLKEAGQLIEKYHFKDLRVENLKFTGMYYKQTGNYPKALNYTETYWALQDSLVNSKLLKIREIQDRYEYNRQQQQIDTLVMEKNTHRIVMSLLAAIIILGVIAFIIAQVLTRQKQQEMLRRKEMELQKLRSERVQNMLYSIADASIKERELQGFFTAVHHSLSAILNTDNFFIALYNADNHQFFSPYFSDSQDSFASYDAKNTLSEYVLKQNGPVILSNSDIIQLAEEGVIKRIGTPSNQWLGVPLTTHSSIRGIISVQSYSADVVYTEADLKILQAAATQVALVLDKKKAAEAVRESEEMLRSFMHSATDAFIVWDKHLCLEDLNSQAEHFLHDLETTGDLVGRHVSEITPSEGRESRVHAYEEVLRTGIPYFGQHKISTSSGFRYYQVKAFRMGSRVGMSISDVSEMMQMRDSLQASLHEKEVMLKEIHHRVKNNMQVISSLLNLQSRYITDAQALEYFKQSVQRVNTMALVHEKLYQSENLAEVRMDAYIEEFVQLLRTSFREKKHIEIVTTVEPVRLSIDAAVPVGLIINELLTNAMKYAFAGRDAGTISITLMHHGTSCRLQIADNGVGLPADVTMENPSTLGMQLVSALSAQLAGTVEVHRDGGTEFVIRFDKK